MSEDPKTDNTTLTSPSETEKLLNKVARKQRVNIWVKRMYIAFMVTAVIYAVLLFVSRLTAVIPDWFLPVTLFLPPGLGVIFAIVFTKRPSLARCARLVDSRLETENLFMTAVEISNSNWEYKPLVIEKAEEKAREISTDTVVPLIWKRKCLEMCICFCVLLLIVLFLPQYDPFGRFAEREKVNRKRDRLKKMDQNTVHRLETLKKRSDRKNSPEVQMALEDLKKLFKTLKKNSRKVNMNRLKETQKGLSSLWKKKNQDKLLDAMQSRFSQQTFGSRNLKRKKWRSQIKKGDFSGIKKELLELQKLAKKLSQEKDSKKKKDQIKKLQQRCKDLKNCLSSDLGSKSVAAALKRAMEQLSMSEMDKLTRESLESFAKSMQLSQRELERLGEMMNDIKNLEQAMKASQLAQQLNKMKQMANAETDGLEDIEDYEQYYDKMLKNCRRCSACNGTGKDANGNPCKACGGGKGKGKPGEPGFGGGTPDEDDSVKTAFKSQVSKSKLQAGKILMQWKTKGISDSGVAKEEYIKTVKEVKQNVSESVLKEQIPPGYHQAIKQYFDSLEKKPINK